MLSHRPLRARFHSAALAANLQLARRQAGGSRLIAVVKADGYGHGVLRATRALAAADALAVLELDAAHRLRGAGWSRRIVLLEGFFGESELPEIDAMGLFCVVHHEEQLRMLEAFKPRRPIPLLLKFNTGMNRLGFALGELRSVLTRAAALRCAGDLTLMTHFACADDDGGIAWQLERFDAACEGLDLPRSLANSAALLRYPATAEAWARPGIMLYGASPFAESSAQSLGLAPGMTLQSALIAVQRLSPGERVGYGGSFVAPAAMRVGIVACGYADGYPRHAATGTPVLVDGVRSRTLGRVSMDMLCVDLAPVPAAGVGSPVVLWGQGLAVEEVAAACGTISYELLCAVAPRVPFVED